MTPPPELPAADLLAALEQKLGGVAEAYEHFSVSRATWYAWRAGGAISRLQRMGLACELSREIGYGAEL